MVFVFTLIYVVSGPVMTLISRRSGGEGEG